MALKREIIIEVDDKGAIKSVDGLTDALDDNTEALKSNSAAAKSAEVDAEAFAASLEKQEARIKVLDGAINLVGGSIETMTGALVLSGAVSEENAEKFEAQAIGAIALADGAKRVFDGYKTLSEGLKAYGGVAGLAQKAQAALNTTILANPYVAAAVAIAALGVAIYAFTREVDEAAEFQREFDAAMNDAVSTTVAQTQALETYNSIVQDSTRPLEERQYALEELNKQGVATEDIDLSNAESLQLLNERTAQAIPLIMARAKASAAAAILEEALKKQLEAQNSSLEDNLTWYQETWSFIKGNVMPGGYELTRVLDGVENKSKAVSEATADVNRAQAAYQETLDELIALEGENVVVQETVRQNLERRAKTDASVKQALTDRAKAEEEAINIYKQVQLQRELLDKEGQERELLAIDQANAEKLEKLKTYYGAESEQVKALEANIESEKQVIRQKYADEAEKDAEDKAKERLALMEEIANAEAVTEEQKFQRSLEVSKAYYDGLIEQARLAGLDTTKLIEAQKNAEIEITKAKNAEKEELEKQSNEAIRDLAFDSAFSLISDLKSLNQIYDKDNEEAARKAFNREKALASVETVISTYLSAQKAYASQLAIPTPEAPVRAAIAAAVAVASGLARLAIINKQQFQSTGTASGAGNVGSTGGGNLGPSVAGFGNAPGGLFPNPARGSGNTPIVKTYVLAGDVTTAQEAEVRIQQRRKL